MPVDICFKLFIGNFNIIGNFNNSLFEKSGKKVRITVFDLFNALGVNLIFEFLRWALIRKG